MSGALSLVGADPQPVGVVPRLQHGTVRYHAKRITVIQDAGLVTAIMTRLAYRFLRTNSTTNTSRRSAPPAAAIGIQLNPASLALAAPPNPLEPQTCHVAGKLTGA